MGGPEDLHASSLLKRPGDGVHPGHPFPLRRSPLSTLAPHTQALVDAVLRVQPEHARLLEKGFSERSPETLVFTERIAALVETLTGQNRATLVAGYLGMCQMILEEEYVFRRTGAYRYSSFDEVNANVYQNVDYMTAYMNGILASQVLWKQHTEALEWYAGHFLSGNPDGYRHLEVGPGHGLLLFHAAQDPRCASLEGWDVSPVSMEKTRRCMDLLGVSREVKLRLQDVMLAETTRTFDSIVISEVCEHLEMPTDALRALASTLSASGRIFINVPINAPCIDHIYLLRSIDEAVEMVTQAGLEVLEAKHFPSAGYTLEKATRRKTSVSCCLIARR